MAQRSGAKGPARKARRVTGGRAEQIATALADQRDATVQEEQLNRLIAGCKIPEIAQVLCWLARSRN